MPHIFISYRRTDSEVIAGRIYDRLSHRAAFGAEQVFKDVDDIPFGVDFRDHIDRAVATNDAILVIIGPQWLAVTDKQGHRRLDDPKDFVRIEVETALKRGNLVVPVLVNDARMPDAADLPPALEPLAYRNAAKVRNDPDFHRDMDRLIADLKHSFRHQEKTGAFASTSPTRQIRRAGWALGALVGLVLLAVIALAAAGIGPFGGDDDDTATPEREDIPTQIAAADDTATPEPTATERPTAEATAAAAAQPTDTPLPTQEPTDTPTPAPTNTPVPSATFTDTPSPTLIPAGTRNRDWAPRIEEKNGLDMAYVPGGCFKMGSDTHEDETPVHEVCLSPFWIGRTEVTNAQYRACVEQGGCTPPEKENRRYYDDPNFDDYPVVFVTWDDAMNFARWWGGALPTEARWEYAARGPEGWTYPWGNGFTGTQVNFCDTNCPLNARDRDHDDGFAEHAPANALPVGASWVGALNMAGNVWEWLDDQYASNHYGSLEAGVLDPPGPFAGAGPVIRGGSYLSDQDLMRAAYRAFDEPETAVEYYGFRVILPGE
ncbi:MAG: SUMF1/EgtB/PvdO family nonheme iron enzyme [Anaerolineae bacterium]|nr:SUMF1/EgtB/PvdO family nonheme iron enzyme [Anaerolineae bacterium]